MKNLLLTVALLLCSVFAFANGEVEKPIEKIVDLELVSDYGEVNNCFGLSCRTFCYAIEESELNDFESLVKGWEEWDA